MCTYPSRGGEIIIPPTDAEFHVDAHARPKAVSTERGTRVSPAESWNLTRDLSPRRTVRVYVTDAAGDIVNSCPTTQYLSAGIPATTWAMNLAGSDQLYRYLCFDLDAKSAAAAAQVPRDLATLTALLEQLHIAHVVCASGPTGGRHVWIGLQDHQAGDTVGQLARLAKHSLPTLDTAPLSNPVTGCVRPPGAPHRSGGSSEILGGALEQLRTPSTTTADIVALAEAFAARAAALPPDAAARASGPLPVDEHGHVYLAGVRRGLSPAAAAALDEDAAQGDASAILWRILLGAAAARWRHDDIAELVNDAPGLEHVRTMRDRSGRARRPLRGPDSAAMVLRRQWDKAVRQIATSDRQGADPTFEHRAAAIAGHVRALQQRADASPGRWHHGAGPTQRRVLDVLSMLALQAVSVRVEADIRRLADRAGIGRETARVGLLQLAEDGWIGKAADAEGPHGAHWTIDPQNEIHREADPGRSQADPPRGSAERASLLRTLTTRTSAARHDLFTHGHSLGIRTGDLYARLTPHPSPTPAIAASLGVSIGWTTARLHVLAQYGLAHHGAAGWTVPDADRRDAVADLLQVSGRLVARRTRYELERELWAWWQAEQTWMKTPPRERDRRRPGPGQLALIPDAGENRHGAHPRRPDGTADYRAARAIAAGLTDVIASTPLPVTAVDDIIARVLGGRLIATERHSRVRTQQLTA